jgi:RimJ/RimL family protein N-acetyltransferase
VLIFEEIDVVKHREVIIQFRRDSFVASFGSDKDFGDDDKHINWVIRKQKKLPNRFVLVKYREEYIGQIELTAMDFEDRTIGFVNLYYLVPVFRGKGLGKELHHYALAFFRDLGLSEFHLRVSLTNDKALRFYQKLGMKAVEASVEDNLIRMIGVV